MAGLNGDTAAQAVTSFANLPIAKQIGILVAIAASVALGVGVVFWAKEPTYRPIFSHLSQAETNDVLDALQKNGIEYKFDNQHGSVLVKSQDIHNARIKLAADGLPRGAGAGYESLNQASGFGTSQFMESARYKHALESELARTISNFQTIKAARVHIALPKESVFMNDKRRATASVFVDNYAGVPIDSMTVSAIIHLVASSVPQMSYRHVTVVDKQGNLLSEGNEDKRFALANKQFKYLSQVEDSYAQKIQDILLPMLGPGKVRAKVAVDMDFTAMEQTRELYHPDQNAIRSEKIAKNKVKASTQASGVPGALANQPPTSTLNAPTSQPSQQSPKAASPQNEDILQATRNYELDKTISYSQQQTGKIRRLTVAVVVDDKTKLDAKTQEVSRQALSEEELKKITQLVKSAVGYDAARGDEVNVVNNAFAVPEPVEAIPSESFWQKAWFWDTLKQLAGGSFVLLLVFGVLMPLLKRLASQNVAAEPQPAGQTGQLTHNSPMGNLPSPDSTHEDRMLMVQTMAGQNPKKVANIVKNWVDRS